MPTVFELIYITSVPVALFLYWKTYKSLDRMTALRDDMAEKITQQLYLLEKFNPDPIDISDIDQDLLVISTAALIKCGVLEMGCPPNGDDIAICARYITIDEKQTKAEKFDALCRRLTEHFKPTIDNTMN